MLEILEETWPHVHRELIESDQTLLLALFIDQFQAVTGQHFNPTGRGLHMPVL